MIAQTLHFSLSPNDCAIVLNGHRDSLSLDAGKPAMSTWENYQQIIVVDGAWNDFANTDIGQYLHRYYPEKIHVLGDGDSIQKRPVDFIHAPDQNYTDFDKTVCFLIEQSVNSADVFWGSGGEMDHFLGNLSVAAKYASDIHLHFIDRHQCYLFLSTDKQLTIRGAASKSISIYPFPEANVTSQGLTYALHDLKLSQVQQQSLRNTINTDVATLSVREGAVWVFVSL